MQKESIAGLVRARDCDLSANETLQLIDNSVTWCRPELVENCYLKATDSRMRPPDFLHTEAETKLSRDYIAAGAVCRLLTNSERVLEAARETFLSVNARPREIDFSMRLWVDDSDTSQPPWSKPYVRGLDYLVFLGFNEGNSLLANLRTRRVVGRFSPSMAEDRAYCRAVIFPMLLSVIGSTLGVAELHCACVARNHSGVLLAGPSGAGKSTLALALSHAGFGFVSDDRTFCSLESREVHAWGLPTRLKLRPDAGLWFRELQAAQPLTGQEQMADLWLEPEQIRGVKRVRRCKPGSVIFLERCDDPAFRLKAMSSDEAQSRLTQDLMVELPEAAAKRSATVERIVDLPCWLLEYGGQPQMIARQISQRLDEILDVA